MDQSSLVIEETDAGAEFVRQLKEHIPVKVAFWLRPVDSGQWYLYIASEEIDDTTLDRGYRDVLRISKRMMTPYLDPFQVKLIRADDPLAQAALDINRRYPGTLAAHFGGKHFGGIGVDGVFIYPSSVTAAV